MKIEYAALSDPGMVRNNNEDSYLALPEHVLFAVADGMGGHNSGELASSIAVETLTKEAEKLNTLRVRLPWWRRIFKRPPAFDPIGFLRDAITRANDTIYKTAMETPENKGMGTTVATVFKNEDALLTAHVGDSRVYRLRGSELTQLTHDHSLSSELVRQGVLTPEEALYSTPKNVLTRALGVRPEVEVEIVYHSLEPGEIILIGSDGLTNMVEDEDIARILARRGSTLKDKVDTLIDTANKAGGEDNITAVLIGFSD